MNTPLLAPPLPRGQGLTLQQQRHMFAFQSRAVPLHASSEQEDEGEGEEEALRRAGSATSTMEWRPLSMEQVLRNVFLCAQHAHNVLIITNAC